MVNYSAGGLDATFGALADPTRRAILARLASEPDTSVTELASPFRMSLPAVSRHLRVLEDAADKVEQRFKVSAEQPMNIALDSAGQLQGGRPGPYQSLRPGGPERPATTQNEQRLEQAGLARGIGTTDQVAAGVQLQLGSHDAAEVLDD